MPKHIFLLLILCLFMFQCGTPPPDHKSCDEVDRVLALLVYNDPKRNQEDKNELFSTIMFLNQRCRKKYDDYKKISPFL